METTITRPVTGPKKTYSSDVEKKSENISVFGIFKSRATTEDAVGRLKIAGFRSADVSVLMPDKDTTKEFAHEVGTKAPEGATTGAGAGLVLGGTFGWLAGVGALAIPGIGPLIAVGPIMAALAGAGVGSALGGVSGALLGMGIPEFEAKRYEGAVKDGGILLSVHCDTNEWVQRAKDILKEIGAQDIVSTTEAKS